MDLDGKINILHVRSCRGKGGGPEKTILFSSREVDRRFFNLHICYLKSQNDTEFNLGERASKLGIDNFMIINENRKLDFAALRELYNLLKQHKIDILHCHCYKSDLYGLILSRFYKMKLVTTAHGPLASLRFFWASQNLRVRYIYDKIDLRILKYFDAVLMVSDSMRRIISKYKVEDRKLIWVRNAIDSDYFRRNPNNNIEFKTSQGIPDDATIIGAVGRLNGEKDYPNLLQAAKILLKERDHLYFIIAGEGPLEETFASSQISWE